MYAYNAYIKECNRVSAKESVFSSTFLFMKVS